MTPTFLSTFSAPAPPLKALNGFDHRQVIGGFHGIESKPASVGQQLLGSRSSEFVYPNFNTRNHYETRLLWSQRNARLGNIPTPTSANAMHHTGYSYPAFPGIQFDLIAGMASDISRPGGAIEEAHAIGGAGPDPPGPKKQADEAPCVVGDSDIKTKEPISSSRSSPSAATTDDNCNQCDEGPFKERLIETPPLVYGVLKEESSTPTGTQVREESPNKIAKRRKTDFAIHESRSGEGDGSTFHQSAGDHGRGTGISKDGAADNFTDMRGFVGYNPALLNWISRNELCGRIQSGGVLLGGNGLLQPSEGLLGPNNLSTVKALLGPDGRPLPFCGNGMPPFDRSAPSRMHVLMHVAEGPRTCPDPPAGLPLGLPPDSSTTGSSGGRLPSNGNAGGVSSSLTTDRSMGSNAGTPPFAPTEQRQRRQAQQERIDHPFLDLVPALGESANASFRYWPGTQRRSTQLPAPPAPMQRQQRMFFPHQLQEFNRHQHRPADIRGGGPIWFGHSVKVNHAMQET